MLTRREEVGVGGRVVNGLEADVVRVGLLRERDPLEVDVHDVVAGGAFGRHVDELGALGEGEGADVGQRRAL